MLTRGPPIRLIREGVDGLYSRGDEADEERHSEDAPAVQADERVDEVDHGLLGAPEVLVVEVLDQSDQDADEGHRQAHDDQGGDGGGLEGQVRGHAGGLCAVLTQLVLDDVRKQTDGLVGDREADQCNRHHCAAVECDDEVATLGQGQGANESAHLGSSPSRVRRSATPECQ